MATDKNSMIQEVVDPSAPTESRPKDATNKETAKTPVADVMEGDIPSAAAQLKKVLIFLESQDSVNDEMITRAKKIRDHYTKTKSLSQEQFDWIKSVTLPVIEEVPEQEINESPEPVDDPEDAGRIAALAKKRAAEQLARNGEAPSLPKIPSGERIVVKSKPDIESVEQVMAEVTADLPPSGEEEVDTTPKESIVEEKPADEQV